MRELGYAEGHNLVIEWRFADGNYERLSGLATDLVQLKPELIMTHSTPATEALRRATSTIPIVATGVGDPVRSGLVTSLARPEGNITGLSIITTDVSAKYVELLQILIPKLSRAAFLMNPGTSLHAAILKGVQAASHQVGVEVLPVDARTPEDIERGFSIMREERVGAVIVAPDAFFVARRRQILELIFKDRLPSMFSYREDVEAGGLMSYGQNIVDLYRHAAVYVDKILKGAKPGELPFAQPTKIHLAINHKMAKVLGLTIPQSLLLRADEVIQ